MEYGVAGTGGKSSYEVWVLSLRAWQNSPNLPLLDLPELDESSFTPETFSRLLTHIENAINTVMKAWGESLDRVFSSAHSDHDLARDLVNLRVPLARRLQLAKHPSLPARVRVVLEADAERHIRALQAEIEEKVQRSGNDLRSDRPRSEQLLRVVRANSFVAVLDMETFQDGSAAVAAALQAADPGPAPMVADSTESPVPVRPSRWAHRTLRGSPGPAAEE